jgi:hypothetical protein
MRSSAGLKRAALAAALFVSGLVAGGLALRSTSNPIPAAQPAPIQVVHKRKVRTVHVRPAGSAGSSSTNAPSTATAPVSAPAVTPVSSRTSPGAAAGGGEGGDGGEVERGD